MNLIKLFGISVLAIGLTACGGADNGTDKTNDEAAAAHEEAAKDMVEETTAAVEETKEAVEKAVEDTVEEVKEAAPEPKELEMPEGMVEGSVEHSIWLNNQNQ